MNIKIYIRTTEPWSQSLVRYLNSKQIEYTKIDVSIDPAAYAEIVRKTGQKKVPVVEIDGQFIIGFDLPKLEALLARLR